MALPPSCNLSNFGVGDILTDFAGMQMRPPISRLVRFAAFMGASILGT
jgi:hypothetical protein